MVSDRQQWPNKYAQKNDLYSVKWWYNLVAAVPQSPKAKEKDTKMLKRKRRKTPPKPQSSKSPNQVPATPPRVHCAILPALRAFDADGSASVQAGCVGRMRSVVLGTLIVPAFITSRASHVHRPRGLSSLSKSLPIRLFLEDDFVAVELVAHDLRVELGVLVAVGGDIVVSV